VSRRPLPTGAAVSSSPLPRFALSVNLTLAAAAAWFGGLRDRGVGGGDEVQLYCLVGCGVAWCGAARRPTPTRLRGEGVRAGRGFTQKLAGRRAQASDAGTSSAAPCAHCQNRNAVTLCAGERDCVSFLLEPKFSAVYPKTQRAIRTLAPCRICSAARSGPPL
jgi:hypothetical protein